MLSSGILILGIILASCGVLAGALSPRLGVLGMGSGSVAVGLFMLSDVPEGGERLALLFFGSLVFVGAWMFAVGIAER
jgi:hypothetical protein